MKRTIDTTKAEDIKFEGEADIEVAPDIKIGILKL